MTDQLMPSNQNINLVVHEIGDLLAAARSNVARQINSELLSTYWNIGRIIAEYEQTVPERADYGKQTLKELSKALTNEFGKGFSVSNIQFMRRFYQTYQIQQTASVKLTWSHYCELLFISDPDKRSFYEKEAVNANWSVRELKRQIDSSLFERLLLSRGDANKEQVLALAEKGIEIAEPADIIRDPYVFEFLGIPEDKPMLESDLERALVQQIEKFLLELGRGFMFVGTQQRVTINNTHYYVDMVFYNKILRAYVLIELKTTKLTPEAAGQINFYLNYYASEVNDPDDNPERYAQVLTSCRRLWSETAKTLFVEILPNYSGNTYKTKSGREIDISGDHDNNKLSAVIETLQAKAAHNTLVGSETIYLIDWMEQINNRQNDGVHHDITREQAMQCIIHTYIALGDILSLRAEVEKEQAQAT